MQREQQLRETWERGVAWGEAQPAAAITDEGLVLGAGAVLARMGATRTARLVPILKPIMTASSCSSLF